MIRTDFKGRKCEICGKPATRYLFATFLCDDEDHISKAREQRGGPGGHQKKKLFEWGKEGGRG